MVNRNVNWQLSGEVDNIIIVVNVSPLWLFHREASIAKWNFNIEEHAYPWFISLIRQQIQDIATLWLTQNSETWRLEIHKSLLDIFCILIQYFKTEPSQAQRLEYSPKISKAVVWIEEHYRENMTLAQIAAHLHVTSAHLSRLFTAETGVNYRTWLTRVRFRHAAREIALTSTPIGQITSDNGFASMKRFSLLFRERYGMLPSKYRQGVKSGAIVHEPEQQMLPGSTQVMGEMNSVELFSLLSQQAPGELIQPKWRHNLKTQHIHLRYGATGQPIKQHGYVVAVGDFEELLKHHVQQQLACLKERLLVFQVETGDPLSGLFLSQVIQTGETSPTWSRWSNLDLATCFLKKLAISPVINISPFTSSFSFAEYLKWFRDFIRHNILLLGKEYVESWAFILDINQCEPSRSVIPKTYEHELINIIRTLVPQCKIGLAWSKQIEIERCLPVLRNQEFMQFIDFIGVSFSPNDNYDFVAHPESLPGDTHCAEQQKFCVMIRKLRKYGVAKPLYLQSWSTFTGNTLRTNGLFFRGALLMDMLLTLPDEIVKLGVWLNSELQHEVSSSPVIETNSLSLFFNAITKRPIFHIITLKERLAGELFSSGPCWVATHNNGVFNILLFNAVTINPMLSVQEHLLEDYSKRFHVQFDVEQEGVWRIKQWVFDQKNGALYHQYGLHPTQHDRDEETMHYISQRSEPTLTVRDERIHTSWTADIIMDINAVCLLEMRKISD
ncbi:helix-turn-helix domain-containing protein [Buttiauxella brennerae]|uniref:helix-turn-helix domain-containing protein n=1 Tax=Buttiauxella brennerae TaxID=82988 RepID=UPI00286EE348|nr:helix-turn-helix domain-containing protein [Buttiauxella brennerae]